MSKIDAQAWLKEQVNETVKLYRDGQRRAAFEAFSAIVSKGRFQNLTQEEKETALLNPLGAFAAQWQEKEGLVIAGRIRAWVNDHIMAKQKFESAIALDPDFALAYNHRGISHLELGDNQKALQDFNKAIALDPDYVAAYINLGNAYRILGEKQKSLWNLDRAIVLNPEDVMAYFNRGGAYSFFGDPEKALQDYDKAIMLDPEHASAYRSRGKTYYNLGNKQKALSDYDKAIALDQNFSGTYNNRGLVYSGLGNKEKALQDFDKAITLDKTLVQAYYNRSALFEKDTKYKEAIQDLEKVLEHGSDPFWIERAKGRLANLKAKLSDTTLEEISSLIDKIREALRFDGDQITHFTSLDGARHLMLEKSPFRLSEASFMNDPSEGKALFGPNKLPESFNLNIRRKDGEYIKKPFFGCFVEEKMKDDLAMWRLYGHDAAGASITFDRDRLISTLMQSEKLMQNEKLKNLGQEALAGRTIFEFYQIAYFDESGNVVLPGKSPAKTKELQGLLDKLKASLQASEADEKTELSSHPIQEKVASMMYLFKSAQYQYEKEVRLMVNDRGFDVVINSTQFTPPRAYLEIAPIYQAVKCITLGPKVPRSEEWVSAFHYFFEKEEQVVQLHVSNQPYK